MEVCVVAMAAVAAPGQGVMNPSKGHHLPWIRSAVAALWTKTHRKV
jgi:hypothetical protein